MGKLRRVADAAILHVDVREHPFGDGLIDVERNAGAAGPSFVGASPIAAFLCRQA
jgi:hypothetical protein